LLKLASWLVILLGLATAAIATEAPRAGKRVALVIGNSAYVHVAHLANSDNDARLLAGTLKDVGFTLIGGGPLLDLDRAGMARAIEDFGRELSGAEVALFYYSGHGLQVQGVNWLVPVDANPTRPQDLDFQMVDADLVLRQMNGAGTKLNLLLLDACRNNPFATSSFRSVQSGLAEMRAPEGTLISYATQPGNVAWDGAGSHSPYAQALADSIAQPGLDIFHVFNVVGLQVKRTTSGEQQPWVSTSPIDGDFFFKGAPPNEQVAGIARPAPPPPPAPEPTRAAPAPTVPATPTPAPSTRVVALPPCSIIEQHDVGGRLEIRGVAASGPEWDVYRQSQTTRGIRVVTLAVDVLPDFACGPIDTLAPAIRAGRAAGDAITLNPRTVSQGDTLTVTLRNVGQQAVRLDLFLPRGAVRHLTARPTLTPSGDMHFVLPQPISDAPGARVLTSIVTPSPLDLGDRPTTEQANSYLDALRQALPDGARAEIALFALRAKPVQTVGARSSGTTTTAHGARCSGILERAQLGDTLSDVDRAYLRAECR
jgi:Caspase domain